MNDFNSKNIDLMKKIDYYESIHDHEKVKEWRLKLHSTSEEEWYEKASSEIKYLIQKGFIPVYHSYLLKQIVEH